MSRFLWIIFGVMGIGLVLLILNDAGDQAFGFDSDRFASLLYLGLLGAVICAGVLGSGLGFGQLTRNIAVWLAIVLALVAGYQYRYELQDIANRVSAGLVPGSPISLTNDEGRAAVMIDRTASGHFEVRAQIDGTPVLTMVDTGATTTVLTAQDARRIGYDVDALEFDVPVMTANGMARAARIVAGEIRIGDIVRSNVPTLIAEAGRLDRSLLGMNFIGTLSGFDMRGERLILRD